MDINIFDESARNLSDKEIKDYLERIDKEASKETQEDLDNLVNPFKESYEDILTRNENIFKEDNEFLFEDAKRSELPDSAFGVPELRKYPLDTEKHVRSAIKLFNYVDEKYEKELANSIVKKMKEYGINDVKIGKDNRLSKYVSKSLREDGSIDSSFSEEHCIGDDNALTNIPLTEEFNLPGKDPVDVLDSAAVAKYLNYLSTTDDEKTRSEELRKAMTKITGSLCAKIKYIFSQTKLYDRDYKYDNYIKKLFPKYVRMLTAKDLYKLRESIMEHAFTSGRGKKSLRDVSDNINKMTNQDKANYIYQASIAIRNDLSDVLDLIEKLYDKERLQGTDRSIVPAKSFSNAEIEENATNIIHTLKNRVEVTNEDCYVNALNELYRVGNLIKEANTLYNDKISNPESIEESIGDINKTISDRKYEFKLCLIEAYDLLKEDEEYEF
jgi:hypothetical protein